MSLRLINFNLQPIKPAAISCLQALEGEKAIINSN